MIPNLVNAVFTATEQAPEVQVIDPFEVLFKRSIVDLLSHRDDVVAWDNIAAIVLGNNNGRGKQSQEEIERIHLERRL
jgi:hypothetical protein